MKKSAKIAVAVVICSLMAFGFIGCVESAPEKFAPPPPEEAFFPEIEETAKPTWKRGKISVTAWPERMIIQKAWLTLEMGDLESASSRISEITQEMNGFIADSETRITGIGYRKGEITIRVPKDKFLQTIEKIELLGKVESKKISGEDITEEYIDLKSRLSNFRHEEDQLLKILKKAKKVPDILEVEKKLAEVRGEIERLIGRIEYLKNRVEFSTITISLHEPEPITPKWKNAFRTAQEGFLSMINGIIIFFGYALPILIVIGVIWAIVIGCKHLYKSRSQPKLKKK